MADEPGTGAPVGGDSGGGHEPSGAPSAPAPVNFTDDTRFIPPGGKDPVTYKDFLSGYVPKSDLTRMRQQDAAEVQRQREAIRAEETRLKSAAQQLAQRLNPNGAQPAADPFAELEQAPYLSGKDAAGLMRRIVGGIQQRNQQLEQTIGLLHQRLQRAEQGFSTLQGRTQKADVETLFTQTRSKFGLPDNPAVAEMLSDVYHAHEGWETIAPDERIEELGQRAKARYEGLQNVFKTAQQQKVDEARKARLVPPAQPGRTIAKPAKGAGFKSAEQLASDLWPMVHSSDT